MSLKFVLYSGKVTRHTGGRDGTRLVGGTITKGK